ncbi:MBL fold metallo-hydrolase, partial [Micromonospora sp. DH15]|nr:MBL fold metallo-hydrolase [Micromonospora sp. DH15]
AELSGQLRAGHTGAAPPERGAAEAPFGARAALTAARRGYAELDGTG